MSREFWVCLTPSFLTGDEGLMDEEAAKRLVARESRALTWPWVKSLKNNPKKGWFC